MATPPEKGDAPAMPEWTQAPSSESNPQESRRIGAGQGDLHRFAGPTTAQLVIAFAKLVPGDSRQLAELTGAVD
eukprot:4240996-Pyramimonas_sp.AAC.1